MSGEPTSQHHPKESKRAASWSTAAPNNTANRVATGETNTAQSQVQSTGHRPTSCTLRRLNSSPALPRWCRYRAPTATATSACWHPIRRTGQRRWRWRTAQGCACDRPKRFILTNLRQLTQSKRSGRPSLKACDAQNLGHNRPHAVGFPIRPPRGLVRLPSVLVYHHQPCCTWNWKPPYDYKNSYKI